MLMFVHGLCELSIMYEVFSKIFLVGSAVLIGASHAPSAEALPVWAETVSRYYCEFREMGASRSQAMTQARREADNWNDEIRQAGSLAKPSIDRAIENRCPELSTGGSEVNQQKISLSPPSSCASFGDLISINAATETFKSDCTPDGYMFIRVHR